MTVTLPLLIRLKRAIGALRRPSAEENRGNLRARSEELASFRIRDLRAEDIPALAELHAITWADTYPGVLRPPTAALRESQWRRTWVEQDGSWFCLVVEAPDGSLVGFAKGIRRTDQHRAPPAYHAGELNKIYLLRDYQRLGLGRRLVAEVATRFVAMGITSMILFADEGNPTCAFYEALGGQNVPNGDGSINYGNFGWHDILPLAALSPSSRS